MTWLPGKPMQQRIDEDPPPEVRNHIAKAMFRAWYVPFYRYGVIHGDPHLGNYQVRADEGINLLDFGAIRVFPPKFVRGVIDLYEAIRDGDEAKAQFAYEGWGFENLSKAQIAMLNQWAAFVYEPLLQDRVRRIQDNDDPQYGRSVAEKVHAGLKETGWRAAAAGVRADGPFGAGPGQRVRPAAGGAELVPAVPRVGGRLQHGGGRLPQGRRRRCVEAGVPPSV